jgi:hypothetical protein
MDISGLEDRAIAITIALAHASGKLERDMAETSWRLRYAHILHNAQRLLTAAA